MILLSGRCKRDDHLLIPPFEARELTDLGSITATNAFAARADIAPSIVIGRMRHEGLLD